MTVPKIFVPAFVAAAITLFALAYAAEKSSLILRSTAFRSGGDIPRKHTCDGVDVSPPVTWEAAPAGVKTFALLVDDPDAPAGTWVHWVIYDLPATTKELPEGVAAAAAPNGAKQGVNDFRKTGYGGPCPPAGAPHRYFFKLYAVDAATDLKPGATK